MNINPTPRQRGYWLSVVVKLGSGNKDINPHNNITKKKQEHVILIFILIWLLTD